MKTPFLGAMVIPNTVSRGTCSACKDDIIVTSHNN